MIRLINNFMDQEPLLVKGSIGTGIPLLAGFNPWIDEVEIGLRILALLVSITVCILTIQNPIKNRVKEKDT